MDKPKILFLVDVQNWAFDYRAKKWKDLLSDEYDIDIVYLKDYSDKYFPFFNEDKYDGYIFFYYKAICSKLFRDNNIPYNKIAICINSEKWRWTGSQYTYDKYFKNSKLLIGCNESIIKEFSKYTHKITKVTQCIDDTLFYPIDAIKSKHKKMVKIGWCGNPETKEKNIQFLIDACYEIDGIELNIQSKLNQKKLNEWYSTLDFVVCVSDYEGGPNMILEAGACKVPIITTHCGLADELIKHNQNGLLIPFNRMDILIKYINLFKNNKKLRDTFSDNLYNDIKSNWTFDKKLSEIKNAINKLVKND